jgi:hypothetical protein
MTTPVQRISRLLNEGARFMVQIPGQVSIDLTPDVIAAMAGVQMGSNTHVESRNLLRTRFMAGILAPVSISREMCHRDFPHNGALGR